MVKRLLMFSFITLCIALHPAAQDDFFVTQESIFRASDEQWLSQELQRVNPHHFECKSTSHTWKTPESLCSLFGVSISLSQAEIESFHQLTFPKGDCKRYIGLISLCDLYFPLFRKKVESHGLQSDYKFLPLLLSGCNQSFSDNYSRSGLWRMDFLVARKYHLRIDTLVDERRGGDFSTEAALQYLSELSTRYNNDPFKVITAYRRGVPYLESLDLTLSGLAFLNTLDANDQAFFHFYAYTIGLLNNTRADNQLNNYFDIMGMFESVNFEKRVSYVALNEILHADDAALKGMNPVYTGSFIENGYRRVPFMLDKVASLKFEALKDSVYNWQPKVVVQENPESETEETIIRYKVKRGDSLGKIADKYHVTIKQLKAWNKIKGDKISRGQSLNIHTTRKVNSKEKHNSNNIKENVPPKVVENQPPAKVEHAITKQDSIPSAKSETQILKDQINALEKSGDVCLKKKDYSCALKKFKEALALDPLNNDIQRKVEEVKKIAASEKKDKEKVVYTVKSGDSLWKIAHKYKGIKDEDIKKWNKCSDDIRPGQKLIIYPKN